MSTFNSFEGMEAWQKARKLTSEIYSISRNPEFLKDFGLKNHIRKTSISIMANIAEGFERGGKKEFIQFLSISKGSSGELKSHLYIALDQKYIEEIEFHKLITLANEIGKMLNGLMKYLKSSKINGIKYKV